MSATKTASSERLQKIADRVTSGITQRAETCMRAPEIGAIGGALADREFRYVMSTEVPAGFWGDVIKANAWDLSEFKQRKMPFLWMHGRGQDGIPLGRMRSVRKNVESGDDRVLAGIARFMDEGTNDFVDGIHEIAAAGFLPAGSVSFEIKRAHAPTDAEAEQFGLDVEGDHRYSAIVDKAMLIEFSAVNVGADPNAVMARDVNDDGVSLRDFLDQMVDTGAVSPESARALRVQLLGRERAIDLTNDERAFVEERASAEVDGDDGDDVDRIVEGDGDTVTFNVGDDATLEVSIENNRVETGDCGSDRDDAPTERTTTLDDETATAVRELVREEARAFTRALAEEVRELISKDVAERRSLRSDVDAIRSALGVGATRSEDPYDETDG